MKPQLFDDLKKQYDTVHGCYRPEGGPCFYLISDPASEDFGRRRGRRFFAGVETPDGRIHESISLTFLVTQMAQLAKSDLIEDPDKFCRDVGLEWLREMLDRDFTTERNEEVLLTSDSDNSLFRGPSSTTVIQRYQALRNEILHVLAHEHARGGKRVTTDVLFNALCDDPRLINRALNELVESHLIRDLNHSNGMRLTVEGQKAAEAALSSRSSVSVAKSLGSGGSDRFDFFISYASEDKDVAEALDKALSARGYRVWRDRRQLTLGDSLTDKINEGLAQSRFGIVILSKAFLHKNWPRAELDALQARAIREGQKVILPIRRDLNHDEMAKRLPLLGDKLTIAFDQNLHEVIREIEHAVRLSDESHE